MIYLMKITWGMLAVLLGWLALVAIADRANASPICPSLEDASADINFSAEYLGSNYWAITNKTGNVFYVWENRTFCLFTMEASIGKSRDGAVKFINQWNQESLLLKASDDGEMIFAAGYTVLPNAEKSLLAVNLLLFDAQVKRFAKAFFEKFAESRQPLTKDGSNISRPPAISGLLL
ncbi:hypothetical protein AB8880_12740 [Alphaproteobacteria bacterium LSUCC0684]